MEIAIHYDAALGYEEPALVFARRLFGRYDEAIVALALVPEAGGDLAVYLNGALVHSTIAAGRLPRLADLGASTSGSRFDPPGDATR
jgi:hypothetical protein